MSDEIIVSHCSPTLAGIKTANIFSAEYESKKSKDNQNLFPKKNIVDNNNINSEIIISNNSVAEKNR